MLSQVHVALDIFYQHIVYVFLHAGFHGLPFHAGQCGLEGGTEIGVPSLGSCVSALKGSTCPAT